MTTERELGDADKAIPIIAFPFNPKEISFYFKNVRKIENTNVSEEKTSVFRVFDDCGNDTGMISYLGKNEWRVFVDNFPGEKKYFQWNLPIKSLEEFIRDIGRTGLNILPNPLNIQVGSKVKAAVKMENDLRDEGMGVIHCANKGDILIIHDIPRSGVVSVSLENSSHQFNCSLSEITEL